MKTTPMRPLETARLLLREVRLSDLPQYHARLTSDPEVAKYMLWEAHDDLSHTATTIELILAGYVAQSRWHWAIVLKETDQLIGTIALLGFDPGRNTCSFAYMLGREFWGQGYGSEALAGIFRFAFEEMDIFQIQADHFAENPASGRAMIKAGMRQTGTLPRHYEKNGKFYDAIQYTLTKKEWELR